MYLSPSDIGDALAWWLWPFLRISAFVSTVPVFGNRLVPMRVKLLIAIALTLVVAPLMPEPRPLVAIGGETVWRLAQQVLIGLTLGFAVRLALMVLELLGQMIAHLMGLGFAELIDPQNGVSVPGLSQFYIIAATLIFLSLDGHLVAVKLIVDSFSVLPIHGHALEINALWIVSGQIGWVFGAALQLALPGVVTLLIANMAFGVISRSAPQLNIISIGFPMTLAIGFLVIWITWTGFMSQASGVFEQSIGVASELMQAY
ncbi:MAG: flagellar biosynthetic protein FliR [Pseudomonadota bacterium]